MTEPHELPPRLRVKEDGRQVAVCPACQAESPVKVTQRQDKTKPFALRAHQDETGAVVIDEVAYGDSVTFDWSEHDKHVQAHRDGKV